MPETPDTLLRLVQGDGTPHELPLPEGETRTIGRSETCELRLADPRASREHARFTRSGSVVEVQDLGSSTGTRVNGRGIESRQLHPGDRIQVAGAVVELVATGALAAGHGAASAPDGGRWRTLLEILTGLLSDDEADPAALLERMLDALLEAFEADRGMVFLPGEEEGFELSCQRLAPGAEVGDQEPVSRSLIRDVAAAGEPRLASSLETEELQEQYESLPSVLCSILVAPLALEGRDGVLYLDSAMERRRFHDLDRDLLVAFARAAGQTLSREAERRRGRSMAELQRRELAASEMIGASAAMRGLMTEIERAAATPVTVLVTGESGTGKELVARSLHRLSSRRDRAFVAINCAAIPAELIESELFGHEKGAFTGAEARRAGHFELADGGTLLLDEVGELPLSVQAKLLRALQERTVQRVGGTRPVPVDFRLVCATNADLQSAVDEGRFREDLYYRIAVFRLALPPLRERGDDVIEIAGAMLARFAREFHRPLEGISAEAAEALRRHSWPGNVRELRNVIEQAVVRELGSHLSADSVLPALVGSRRAPVAGAGSLEPDMGRYPETIEAARRLFEKEYLLHKLRSFRGNMKLTAEQIGMSRRALYSKCEELGVDYRATRDG